MVVAPIPPNEDLRLRTLYDYSILQSPGERGFDDLAQIASFICGVPISLITFIDRDEQWFKSAVGTNLTGTTREESFCSHVVCSGTTVVVADTLQDERFADNPLVIGELGIRFYAGAPLVAPNGQVLGSICVIDQQPHALSQTQIAALEALSRQVMAQLELRQRMEQNERAAVSLRTAEKLAAVGSMASSVAHEINNPLQSVTNLLYMAGNTDDSSERAEFLRMAQDEVARMTQIVTQSLRFHRQSSGPSPVRLGELAESMLLVFRTRLQHAGASVEVRDTQTAPLTCFADDFRQVIASLLSNALDTLAVRGSGTLRLAIHDGREAATGRPGVFLVIADNGMGIDPAAYARLFQPFNSTKGIRGTGLGLWVMKGIVDKHNGSVRVRSRSSGENTGTLVRIFVPHERRRAAEASLASPVN